ncbi:MAG TPA: hypothetical protein VFI23_14035 [Rhizomicrobium sp.]|nr:hypothetical protein [Rhizomicrobium sp.]
MMRALQIMLLTLLGTTVAADAASLVVVEARGIALRPGATLDASKVLQLKQGQHVTFITDTGSTLNLDGPYNALPQASGGGGVNLGQTLRALVSQRETRRGEYGTTRGVIVAPLPEPWLLDASHSGNGCLLENGTPIFWRPDASAAAKITVAPIDRSWRAAANWPAGQSRLAITTEVPMRGGETYVIVLNGEEFAITMTLLPAVLTNDDMRAAWMANKGCEAQAEALAKTEK